MTSIRPLLETKLHIPRQSRRRLARARLSERLGQGSGVGHGLVPAVHAMCLPTVLYRSRLVPRIIPALGLIGAPLLVASSMVTRFSGLDQVSSTAAVTALPIAPGSSPWASGSS